MQDKEKAEHNQNTHEKLEQLTYALERLNLTEYLRYVDNPRRVIRVNMVAGLSRGLGMAIGFTLLGALVVVIVQRIFGGDQGVSEFWKEVFDVVKQKL